MDFDARLYSRRHGGFTLVELMVAMALGLLLTYAMMSVYLSSRTAFRRMDQLTSLQQGVRTAFEYLSSDARMIGHLGCFTRRDTGFASLAAADITNNYAVGIEGYDYKNATADEFTLASKSPDNSKMASGWNSNAAGSGSVNPIPVTTIDSDGLTPGSDVLVIRTVVGAPMRLVAATTTNANVLTVEGLQGGTCSDGSTAKISGLCANSHALIASCTAARVFTVASITGTSTATLTMNGSLGGDPVYSTSETEVFPLQTIVYYVKKSSSGTATSLYRRIFDGDHASGLEQELIEGVENLQISYGIDKTSPLDGVIDEYVTASEVTSWSSVVAVRMGLLLRSTTPVDGDVKLAASGTVNGVLVAYPTGADSKFDRRVFTTTVAIRNRISYF